MESDGGGGGGGESCYTDYETDGFWSSEKTLLESVRGSGTSAATTAVRKRKKKKKAKDRGDGGRNKEPEASQGLAQEWRMFRREHEEEWREYCRLGRKCFVNTVSGE